MTHTEAGFGQPEPSAGDDEPAAEPEQADYRLHEDPRIIKTVGEGALWDTPSQPEFPSSSPHSSHRGFGVGPTRPLNRNTFLEDT